MTVRTAVIGDAERVAYAHVTGWQTAYEGIVPQTYLDSLDLVERTTLWHSILTGEIVVPDMDPPAFFVAEVDGQVVGFANAGHFRYEPGDTPDADVAGELWAMYIDPDHWGSGVGDELMSATLEELERIGAARSFLWVLEGNGRARRFYERHGWRCDEVIKTFDAGGTQIPEIRYSRS